VAMHCIAEKTNWGFSAMLSTVAMHCIAQKNLGNQSGLLSR